MTSNRSGITKTGSINFHFIQASQILSQPVLFLHGFMGCAEDWNEVINRLADAFFCIAVDLPGHGKTIVAEGKSPYGMETCAASLVAFLRNRKIKKCALVGYSMGGRLALYLALHAPEIFHCVVLESASPGLRTKTERRARIEHDNKLADEIEVGDFAAFLQRWYSQPLFRGLQPHPKFQSLFQKRLQNNPRTLAKSLRGMGTGAQPSLWEKLPALKIPALLLAGENDKKFVQINSEMAKLSPATQVKIIKNAGHTIHFEQPEIFAKYVRHFIGQKNIRCTSGVHGIFE
jgi:2-succinyl-6-hydroxy-2,4-cyclohexadiene-1-carboxylate synthase